MYSGGIIGRYSSSLEHVRELYLCTGGLTERCSSIPGTHCRPCPRQHSAPGSCHPDSQACPDSGRCQSPCYNTARQTLICISPLLQHFKRCQLILECLEEWCTIISTFLHSYQSFSQRTVSFCRTIWNPQFSECWKC